MALLGSCLRRKKHSLLRREMHVHEMMDGCNVEATHGMASPLSWGSVLMWAKRIIGDNMLKLAHLLL